MKSGLLAVFTTLFLSAVTLAQTGSEVLPPIKIKKMKQFSLLVRVPDTYRPEQAKAVTPLWDKLLASWKASGVYVISFAFPGAGYTVTGNKKTVKKETVFSGHLRVVSNIVLQTPTMEQALELSKACPVLPYGGSVEVREIPSPIQLPSAH
ncbi:hypothetical protein GCM10027051_19350 [Niabella terrae]